MPPCTTKRKTTTNLKTKNNQNCQKIKLYGSPASKELKKKVGRVETGNQGGEDPWQDSRWRTGVGEIMVGGPGGPTFTHRTTRRNKWRVRQTTQSKIPAWGSRASKPLTEKTCEG